MKKNEQKVVIKEADYAASIYNTKEWENSVKVLVWEHDFEKKIYTIIFEEKLDAVDGKKGL